jgi:tetratricopeptide (TPR) repeat protein
MPKDDSGFAEIEEYTKKLTQNPESLVFVPLAEAYRKSGMLDEAIEACQKGLQVHPTYMSARMVLGRAYMEKQMFEEAATEFQKVAAADANNHMAHTLLGQILLQQGKHTQAIEVFQKVLTLNPDDSNVQQWLKQALEKTKQNGGAKTTEPSKEKSASSAASKGNAERELSQAEVFTQQGDLDSALKIYRLILEADPENLVVRQRLKDLEVRKAQATAGRKTTDPAKTDPTSPHRENDKITSEDILSVMKDTIPKAPEKPKPKVKTDAPSPTEAAPSSVTAVGSSLAPDIVGALDRLLQTDGIVGLMVLKENGDILHNSFSPSKPAKELSLSTTVIMDKTRKAVQAMHYGEQIKQILITGEKGQILFNKFGERILLLQTDENINIGKLRIAMNDVSKVLHTGA